jgi:UDP-4-amino-4,6-dideoxy-N-acetyl-beta-L-altrosamine transaminase/dTDP-4-dehydrorhamnose reductase
MQKKILITGGSGLLAVNWALSIRNNFAVTLLLHHKTISIKGVNTDTVSLESVKDCKSVLTKHQPNIVIHTAGMTDVDKCESNIDLAHKVNVGLTSNLSAACNDHNIKLVHISTDHLFSGNQELVTEESSPNPLNIYSKTKLQAEQKVLKICPDALVIRTNFFGWGPKYRQSFSDFILSNLRNNKSIDLFSDVYFTPILIDELSNRTHQLLDLDARGVFNIVGSERISKYEFGVKLARSFNLDARLIKAVSINDASKLIKRPKDMSLSNAKFCQKTHRKISSLDDQILAFKNQEDSNASSQVFLKVIPYGKHYIDEEDISSVVEVLRYGMLTQGPKILEFEQKIAKYVGSKYAVAVANGTAALHLSNMALKLGKGDEVITSPNTFVATSNSVLYVGAKLVFVDIDKKTLNIDIDQIENVIQSSNNIKAIFPVHFAGLPCDMERIKKIANKYNLAILEDASHALGAKYIDGSRVGNCKYSDLTVLSFHPVKGISAGEGGMITTNDYELYHKLTILRSHGITKGNFEFPGKSLADSSLVNKDDALENGELRSWYYEMQYLGYNYRITDIQCSLAISQMNKIDIFLEGRKSMVSFYDQAFAEIPNILPLQVHGRKDSSHHIYLVSINFQKINMTRHRFMKSLAEQGVGSQVHYIPVVLQPYYQGLGYDIEQYPLTKQYYQTTLSIPLYYGLSNAQQQMVVSSIINLLQ